MITRRKPLERTPFLVQRKPLAKVGARAKRERPTAAEKRHIARVASLPCLVSGKRPVTVHHVTATVDGGRISRSPRRVVPLRPEYHLIQFGPRTSVEALGHGGFHATYGIDLLAVSDRLWEESQA